jgi:subtilisin-like proprotein convertase family protein
LGIVQLLGPVSKTPREALLATGAKIVHYLPQNAYIIWTDDQQQRNAVLDLVTDGKTLQFFDDFLEEDALSPQLDAMVGGASEVEVTVQVYNVDEKAPAAAALIAADRVQQVMAFATEVIRPAAPVLDGLYTNMTIRVPAPALPVIAAMDAVVNVEPYIEPVKNSERQAQEMAGNLNAGGTAASGAGYLAWLSARGFPTTAASYPLLTMTDDGVDNGSTSPLDQTLRVNGAAGGVSRVISNVNATADATGDGKAGHGHLNTTIALGYDAGMGVLDAVYLRAMGISPYGRIAGMKIFANAGSYDTSRIGSTDAALIAAEYNQGADMSSNSWGAATAGAYNATAQAYDSGTRDATSSVAGNQQLFFIFSAGNSGSGAQTIGSPGTAKNVLTVGASEDTDADGTDGCVTPATDADNIQQIVGFSSRGPCSDGRKKPEIVAPGTHITGRANPTSGYTGGGVCDQYWPTGQTIYARSSGTSHSTPAVAGMASLTWNYLNRQYGITRPSPALLKAYIIHSARYLTATGGNLPHPAQGYGFANMDLAFSPTVSRMMVDQTNVFGATGESQTLAGSVADSTKPIRVALAWTDPAGTTTGSAWVNDLNLTVTVGGVTYKGNVFTGANSVSGGTADAADNYECVFLPAGVSGAMTVTVTAANIAGNGVPGNADATDQDYALVISNFSQSGVALSGTGVNTVSDTTGNGNANGRIDPGETAINLTLPVQNTGPSTATGVSATLVSNTATVSVTTATSAYANLVGSGGTASNATPYVLNVSPSHPCGSPIALTLNITSGQGTGSYLLSLPTGLAGSVGSPVTVSYTGPAVAIPDNVTTGAVTNLSVSGLVGTVSNIKLRFDGSSCNATAGSTTVGLDHTYVGDLTITLQSPSGTVVTVMSRPGGTGNSGNNFCGTVLDDAAASPIQSITAAGNPWTGSFSPNSPLSAFNGQNPNGTWILKAVDGATVDTGSIRAFSLIVTTTAPTSCDPPNSGCVGAAVTANPTAVSVCSGLPASFTVTASGTPTPTFQWRKGANNISGATSATYSITSVVAGDAANYDCVVTNSCGTATSTAAALTVNTAPAISGQPASLAACTGSAASFTVSASGSPAPTYQWRKGGNNISGANSATYGITSVFAGDAANYDCVITNSCGSVTSNAASLTVNASPVITTQPQTQTTCSGGSVTYSIVASGTPAPTYQWRKNATDISGATSSSFTIPAATAANVGLYDCVVTNTCGSVPSSGASLNINTAAAITGQPSPVTVCAGSQASFSVVASGSPVPTYQWRKGGTNISGATSATYTIAATTVSDAASYDCVVTNTCGFATSTGASLTINTAPSIGSQPAPVIACSGQSATFSVTATGSPAPSYQWRKGGNNISGATSASYTIAATTVSDAATYDCVVTNTCGGATSTGASLTINTAPSIGSQPAPVTVCSGLSASFSVTATGSPVPSYQWRKGSVNISGATLASYTIAATTGSDAATYDCIVTNSCGSATSSGASLTINTAPSIGAQPSPVTVCSGRSVSFSVTATGSPVPTYQWRKGGNNIPGANSANYTIPSVLAGDADSYDCVVTNTCGSIASSGAQLTVNTSPVISTQPSSSNACVGSGASFSVAATGSPAPSYQWRRAGAPISGANSATYSIASVVAGDAASYDCVITNTCGFVTSGSASLTVSAVPSVTSDPQNVNVCAGLPASFSVTATGATSYQWTFNGLPLNGATVATYSINSASAADAGTYVCVVTNSCGSVNSQSAQLAIGGIVPVNDELAGALLLTPDVAQSRNTCSATIDSSAPVCFGQAISAPGVWFKLPGSGHVATVTLCGSSFDTRLSAFCGLSSTLTCVAGNDDFCGTSSGITFCTQTGADYYILVHGFNGAVGAFTIVAADDGVSCTPQVACIPVGACCLATGCQQLTPADCSLLGGSYQGDAVTCSTPSFDLAYASTDSFPLDIPDATSTAPGVVVSTLTVAPGSGTVSALAARIGLEHTFAGDLSATLSHGAVSVTLFNQPGASNDLLGTYTFSDFAARSFVDAAAATSPIASGVYIPLSPLSAFDGQPFDGTWVLTVTDNATLDTGRVNSFELLSTTLTPACTGCAPCPADYNQDGGVDGNDVNAFYEDWEAGRSCADVNLDGGVDGADIDTFFSFWELGGC